MKKIPKLQKNQQEVLEEWKDNSARFEKSLRKTEEKLKEQTATGREVSDHFFLGSCFSCSLVVLISSVRCRD